jgi:hypothetical protein
VSRLVDLGGAVSLPPVLIGFRFVRPITGQQVPQEWLARLEDRRVRHDELSRQKAERIRRSIRAGRTGPTAEAAIKAAQARLPEVP